MQKRNHYAIALMRKIDNFHDRLVRFYRRLSGKKITWPVTYGKYVVGNDNGPVAICTLMNTDLIRKIGNLHKIAVVGRTYTPNLGIEKIIKNVVSNPNIRFLILCGRESKEFFVGQALKCLVAKGVDENRRIIDAIGPWPFVRNVSDGEINAFREQVEIVDLIGEERTNVIIESVDECLARNLGAFGRETMYLRVKTIVAFHSERKDLPALDELGFFVISIKPEKNEILVEHYSNERVLTHMVVGKTAEEISHTLVREGLLSQLTHAAYVGRELQKAEFALKFGLDYEQDKPLKRSMS